MNRDIINDINDTRMASDFRGITLSMFKKSDSIKEMRGALLGAKVEQACYWSAELICAGHYADVWECVFLFYGKYVHITNPRIAVYLDVRLDQFETIMHNGYSTSALSARNNGKIRRMFAEIMCVLCDAKRSCSMDSIAMGPAEFDMLNLADRLKAPSLSYGIDILTDEDPRELCVAVNELSFHLSVDSQNLYFACYWAEWIMGYAALCKKKGEPRKCERRATGLVDGKYQKDVVWIIWDIFSICASNTHDPARIKLVEVAQLLFSYKYTPSCCTKRRYMLYFAAEVLCGKTVDMTDEIIRKSQKANVGRVMDNIDCIYRQIKKNEVSPNTDYLFDGSGSGSNLKNTINQLETMSSFGDVFIPRLEETDRRGAEEEKDS